MSEVNRSKKNIKDGGILSKVNPIVGVHRVFSLCKSMHPGFLLVPVLLFVFICLTAISSLPAQTFQSGLAPTLPAASAASYYYIAKPGELTMQVNVWGFVKNPGRYEVASSTDLIQLISYAGGPTENAKLSDVRIVRLVVRDSTLTPVEIVVHLDRTDELDARTSALLPGDTIFIDRTGWSTVRDAFSVVTTVGIITTAIAQLLIAVGR